MDALLLNTVRYHRPQPFSSRLGGEDLFTAIYGNPERLRLFLRSMTGHSLPSAMAIA